MPSIVGVSEFYLAVMLMVGGLFVDTLLMLYHIHKLKHYPWVGKAVKLYLEFACTVGSLNS